jgi:hypothetical protein
LQGQHYYVAPYLSPFYEPLLFVKSGIPGAAPVEHAWFGEWPSWWPAFLPPSPALLILTFPAAFRFTCYYYRKSYYRAFAFSPPGCAVVPGATDRRYGGEVGLLVFQNLHRYAFYFAVLYVPVLYTSAFRAFVKDGQFGIGVGTVLLLVNATLITGYTLGCHAFRHLIGGHDDCMSCGQATLKHRSWKGVSMLNARHAAWAWASLFSMLITELYVRGVAMGVIHDLNTWD